MSIALAPTRFVSGLECRGPYLIIVGAPSRLFTIGSGKMQLISVQLAIDLYMGLGQGKRRAVELNLCLEDIKRGW